MHVRADLMHFNVSASSRNCTSACCCIAAPGAHEATEDIFLQESSTPSGCDRPWKHKHDNKKDHENESGVGDLVELARSQAASSFNTVCNPGGALRSMSADRENAHTAWILGQTHAEPLVCFLALENDVGWP